MTPTILFSALKAGDVLELEDGTKHVAVADSDLKHFQCATMCSIADEDCCRLIPCNKSKFHFELKKL